MEASRAETVVEDVAIFPEEMECHRDKPNELRALFYAALHYAIRKNVGVAAFDKIIMTSISHRSLQSDCLVIAGNVSDAVKIGLRRALVNSGTTMDAIEIAATMRMPLTREEIVLLGNNLGRSHEPLSSAKNLLDYARQQSLPELDMRRLATQVAEIERTHRATDPFL